MEIHWDDTVARSGSRCADTALQQDWAYGAACAALGSQVFQAEVCDAGQVIARAQVIARRLLGCVTALVCTRGPVWQLAPDYGARTEAIRLLTRHPPVSGWRAVFVTPDAREGEGECAKAAGLQRVMTPYTTAVLDLTRCPETLRAGLHQKWRNRLVVAERSGLVVGRDDGHPRLYDWLLHVEAEQQRKKRYTALPVELVSAWNAAGGNLRVLSARDGDRTVAAMLFLLHGRRATYHIGWSSPDGKHRNAHNLLMWRAVLELRAAGVTTLDLGGLNTEDLPGIARFKLGTGATPLRLCGTWVGR